MSYLTGKAIKQNILQGKIEITPFLEENIGPNSVDLRLHHEMLVYEKQKLDMRKDNPVKRLTIPPEGFLMVPGELYLCRTIERTKTPFHVPCVEGRSSVGRLGIAVHVTAGFGDHGFDGTWTLEVFVQKPVIVYAGERVCQVSFQTIEGDVCPYNGRYQNQENVTKSRFWMKTDV